MTTHFITFSHKPHQHTMDMLEHYYGHITHHHVGYHSEDRDLLEEEIEQVLEDLKAKGALEGRVLFTAPSIAAATYLITIGIHRETGVWPDLVNVLQCSDGRYRPSTGKPVFQGRKFADKRRRLRVS